MDQIPSPSATSEVRYANVSSDERTMAILCHVLSIFFWFIPTLIIYLVKKDESAYVGEQAKEALNFQLSLFIYYAVSLVLMLVLIGVFLFVAIYFGSIILCIVATVKASNDTLYRYPFNLRLIK
jgi:uncharacterized protein